MSELFNLVPYLPSVEILFFDIVALCAFICKKRKREKSNTNNNNNLFCSVYRITSYLKVKKNQLKKKKQWHYGATGEFNWASCILFWGSFGNTQFRIHIVYVILLARYPSVVWSSFTVSSSKMTDLPFQAEYAKTGRAACKGCKAKIDQGVLRLAIMVQVSTKGP